MSPTPDLAIAIKQIRGNSGIDVWAKTLCQEINRQGPHCTLDLPSGYFQFFPGLLNLNGNTNDSDIIQSSSWNGYAFRTENPLVVTEHLAVYDPAYNYYRTFSQKIFHRWVHRCEKKTLDVADTVVCVSEDTREKFEAEFGYPDARVIHNGVDTEFFRPGVIDRKTWNLPENKTVLLFAGNLSRRKGADLLPAIMNELGDDFILLTTSGNRDKSQNSIPHSRDLGHLNLHQLIEAYNLCDIFLLPSRLEGLSLSTLEAMACAKPVVAFNCSSFPELILDGKGGFLSEKDNVNDLVERIRYLSQEPDLVRSMGTFNRDRVLQNFTVSRMANEYIRLYQSLLS
jgi:glycosyltransferase involved in cell wall biosynthesis